MIGAPLPPSFSLHVATALRPAAGLGAPQPAGHAAWLEGLGLSGGAVLRADVAAEQRGLSVQQHAERVLAALVG